MNVRIYLNILGYLNTDKEKDEEIDLMKMLPLSLVRYLQEMMIIILNNDYPRGTKKYI